MRVVGPTVEKSVRDRPWKQPGSLSPKKEYSTNMPKTAVGLFEHHESDALGFPGKEVQTLEEPTTFEVTGVMSFPHVDFEVALLRELTRFGATKAESQAYAEGLRRGGPLVFATGSAEKVDVAAEIMNQHGAVKIKEAAVQNRICLRWFVRASLRYR
jgi:hypothetical protein